MSLIHNSGGSRGWARGPGPAPLIFRPNWGPKSRKNIFGTPSRPLISGSGWPPPPPLYLEVWIRRCIHTHSPHRIHRAPLLRFLPSFIQPAIESFILAIWIHLFLCPFNFTDEEQVVNGHKIKVANAGEPQNVFSQVDSNNVALTVHGPGSASVTSNVKGGSTQTVIFDPRPYDPCPGVKCPKENGGKGAKKWIPM